MLILAGIFGSRGNGSNSSSSDQPAAGGTSTATTQEAAAADTGPAFPGKKEGDVSVQAGGTVTIDGLAVTSTPLRRGASTFEKTLCTTLTYANGGSRNTSFGMFDYKLQDPKGAIVNPTFFGGGTALDSGDLAPGGKVSGDVCFEDKANAKGLYIVLYEPNMFLRDRGAFLNQR
ncbi:DUF4352 domain-containing protein [Pseudonocardia sp. RS11V-5]|uniref:DUF4352 domain-containing protein n=1 Tax=Pseudonocardia terrae TaxID=2905831 RepID=UPI001E3CEF75|nr:DUF4352 domain-containing protein [Pseudonocardia terrae]MCE3554429.1 DUF4352 domain-containing protein [Pseudonocardia terrae]